MFGSSSSTFLLRSLKIFCWRQGQLIAQRCFRLQRMSKITLCRQKERGRNFVTRKHEHSNCKLSGQCRCPLPKRRQVSTNVRLTSKLKYHHVLFLRGITVDHLTCSVPLQPRRARFAKCLPFLSLQSRAVQWRFSGDLSHN
jgi:hypothetical protein